MPINRQSGILLVKIGHIAGNLELFVTIRVFARGGKVWWDYSGCVDYHGNGTRERLVIQALPNPIL
jgi:hypothetical protein